MSAPTVSTITVWDSACEDAVRLPTSCELAKIRLSVSNAIKHNDRNWLAVGLVIVVIILVSSCWNNLKSVLLKEAADSGSCSGLLVNLPLVERLDAGCGDAGDRQDRASGANTAERAAGNRDDARAASHAVNEL